MTAADEFAALVTGRLGPTPESSAAPALEAPPVVRVPAPNRMQGTSAVAVPTMTADQWLGLAVDTMRRNMSASAGVPGLPGRTDNVGWRRL